MFKRRYTLERRISESGEGNLVTAREDGIPYRVWPSQRKAARDLGVQPSVLSKFLSGKTSVLKT